MALSGATRRRSCRCVVRSLPTKVSLLLLALAPGAAAHADPTSPAATNPALVVVPERIDQSEAAALLGLPAGPAVQLSAAPGALDPPFLLDGTWRTRYRPPEPAEPGAALFHAAPAASPCGGTWALARRSTRATHELRTKPRARVTVLIGGAVAGTGVADSNGRARVQTVVQPEDDAYEVEAVDRLGNRNLRQLRLPSPTLAPPLLAGACSERVEAGRSLIIAVAAVDHRGKPAPVTFDLPPGITVLPSALGGEPEFVHRFHVYVAEGALAGPTVLRARNGAAEAVVGFTVVPSTVVARPAPVARVIEGGLSLRPTGPRPRLGVAAEVGASSNLADQVGVTASAALYLRLPVLDQRLCPRLLVGVDQLWGNTRAGAAAAVAVLVVPVELGAAATLLRAGSWDADLELGAGAALSRVSAAASAIAAAAEYQRFSPSLSAALAVRRHIGRGAVVARATWRQVFSGSSASAVEAQDNRGFIGLAIGGELDVR